MLNDNIFAKLCNIRTHTHSLCVPIQRKRADWRWMLSSRLFLLWFALPPFFFSSFFARLLRLLFWLVPYRSKIISIKICFGRRFKHFASYTNTYTRTHLCTCCSTMAFSHSYFFLLRCVFRIIFPTRESENGIYNNTKFAIFRHISNERTTYTRLHTHILILARIR